MDHYGAEIDEIIERYPAKPEYLILLMQDVQAASGYISSHAMQAICDRTQVPLTQAYSVATFYKSFRLDPSGEHEIRVCLGTACHLKGGPRILDELQRRLGVGPGETTQDQRFTLNTVNCVGACALAPVIMVDEEYQPNMTAGKLEKHLKALDPENESIGEVAGHV